MPACLLFSLHQASLPTPRPQAQLNTAPHPFLSPPTEPYTSTLLDAYNAAWSTALRNAGYAMNTAASAFNPNGGLQVPLLGTLLPAPRGFSAFPFSLNPPAEHTYTHTHTCILSLSIALTRTPASPMQQNVSNVNGAPYYYPGDAAGQPNLYTNVTVAVDARLDLATLFALLNTSAVAQDILEGISGGWGCVCVCVEERGQAQGGQGQGEWRGRDRGEGQKGAWSQKESGVSGRLWSQLARGPARGCRASGLVPSAGAMFCAPGTC